MPIIATDTQRLSNVVKHEYNPEIGYCRGVVTKTTTVDYPLGTVLGKVTATGAYRPAVETAVDGSKVPAAIALEDQTKNGVNTKCLVLLRGPSNVSKGALLLDATYNDATKKATAYAALEALGILVNETV